MLSVDGYSMSCLPPHYKQTAVKKYYIQRRSFQKNTRLNCIITIFLDYQKLVSSIGTKIQVQ